MFFRLLLFLFVSAASAVAQTVTVPTANAPHTDPNAGIVCPKARQALEANHQKQVVVQMIVNSDGSVNSFKILSPKGLHLEKDPEVRKGFKTLHFNPARKDGTPVVVLINMEFNCSFDQSATGSEQQPPTR
jgi:TonB family protein